MEPMSTAKSEMSGVERLATKIPGYSGYKEKEVRRAADKQIRDTVARRLEARRRKITALQGDLLSSGGLLWMDDMERLVGRLQLLIDRIKTASYGYAPFFDLQRVKEDDLDRMIRFDDSLIDEVGRVDEAVSALEQAVRANEKIGEAIRAAGDLLAGLNETFSRREEVIRNAQ
jgi:hypothetical protein